MALTIQIRISGVVAAWILALTLIIPLMTQAQETQMPHSSAQGGAMAEGIMGVAMHGSMGPHMTPPPGVMGGHSPGRGDFMLMFQAMHMRMDGYRDGTNELSTAEVLEQFPVAPLEMDMEMLMLGGMYGITADVSVMAMLPYIRKEMPHVTRSGVNFTTQSDGIGDIKLLLNYQVARSANHALQVGMGLNLPTGSIDQSDTTPAGPNQLLPYPMQLGSGTYDLLPTLTYTGQTGDYAWGTQFSAAIRLGDNDQDYRLGNLYQLSIWGTHRWNPWLSTSLRVQGEIEENIEGADRRLNPNQVPTADPSLRAGKRINIGVGVNLRPISGLLAGTILGLEVLVPAYQALDGPQLERDYTVMLGLRRSF